MNEKDKFSSAELQKIDSVSESILQANLQKVIKVSNDIKVLETKLRAGVVPFDVIYICWVDNTQHEITEPYLLNCYTAHCIFLGKNDKGVYRLSYNQYYVENKELYDIEKHKFIVVSRKKYALKYSKPLDETKSLLRLKMGKELSNFYQVIISSLQLSETKELIIVPSSNIDTNLYEEVFWDYFLDLRFKEFLNK